MPRLSTHPLECHITRNFENNDAHEHELVSQVDGRLIDADILGESSGESACQIHTVQLEDEQPKHQQ